MFLLCREKDLDEVLQTTTVFSNVSKGVLAKREDLIQVFGTDDEHTICIKILADGEMQVSDKERKVELDTLFRDVAAILSEKCVNPKSKKPYTIGVLERALKDIHFSVDPKKPAKLQAVEVRVYSCWCPKVLRVPRCIFFHFQALPLLKAVFPIERAQMQLKITIPVSSFQDLEKILKEHHAAVMEQNIEDDGVVVECCIDPGAYRKIHGFVQDEGQHGRLEVVSLNAFVEGPHDDSAEDVVESLENISLPAEAAVPSEPERPRIVAPVQTLSASEQTVVFQRGPIADIPDEFASRRDRFSEIDELQPGWTVQLKQKGNGSVVDAVFFSPSGEKVGSYAVARRMALAYHKKA